MSETPSPILAAAARTLARNIGTAEWDPTDGPRPAMPEPRFGNDDDSISIPREDFAKHQAGLPAQGPDERDPEAALARPVYKTFSPSYLANLPPQEWLIDGYFLANALMMIAGQPEAGKTFLSLDVACSIATGASWHGHHVKQGRVIYISLESSSGLSKRIEAWKLAHPNTDTTKMDEQLFFITAGINLTEPLSQLTLLNTVADIDAGGHVALVIVDTLSRALVGVEENSAKEVGKGIDMCERLRDATSSSVLLVHHTQKIGNAPRGSSVVHAAVDAEYLVSKDEESGVSTLACTKMKDSPRSLSKRFDLKNFAHSVVPVAQSGATRGWQPPKTGNTWDQGQVRTGSTF